MDVVHLSHKTCTVNASSDPRAHPVPLSPEQFEIKKKKLELAISSLSQYNAIADNAEAVGAAALPRDVISDFLNAFKYDEMLHRRTDIDATFQNVSCFVSALEPYCSKRKQIGKSVVLEHDW